MSKEELRCRLINFYGDSKKLAEKEKRCLEDKDKRAFKEILKILS